jgi:hypothetical protein
MGVLIGLPAIVVYRRDIANSIRSLGKSPKGTQNEQEQQGGAQRVGGTESRVGDGETKGLSPAIAIFAICAAAITALYGVLSATSIFLVSGIFGILCVVLAFFGSRATLG